MMLGIHQREKFGAFKLLPMSNVILERFLPKRVIRVVLVGVEPPALGFCSAPKVLRLIAKTAMLCHIDNPPRIAVQLKLTSRAQAVENIPDFEKALGRYFDPSNSLYPIEKEPVQSLWQWQLTILTLERHPVCLLGMWKLGGKEGKSCIVRWATWDSATSSPESPLQLVVRVCLLWSALLSTTTLEVEYRGLSRWTYT